MTCTNNSFYTDQFLHYFSQSLTQQKILKKGDQKLRRLGIDIASPAFETRIKQLIELNYDKAIKEFKKRDEEVCKFLSFYCKPAENQLKGKPEQLQYYVNAVWRILIGIFTPKQVFKDESDLSIEQSRDVEQQQYEEQLRFALQIQYEEQIQREKEINFIELNKF